MKQIFIILIALLALSTNLSAQTSDSNIQTTTQSRMYFDRGNIYLGENLLSEKDLRSLLPIDLYKQASGGLDMHRKGKKLIITGSILAGVSIIGTITGSAAAYNNPEAGGAMLLASLPFYLGGVACLGVGIPFYFVGRSRVNRASTSYNNSAYSKEITFNFGATQNGTGFFINF